MTRSTLREPEQNVPKYFPDEKAAEAKEGVLRAARTLGKSTFVHALQYCATWSPVGGPVIPLAGTPVLLTDGRQHFIGCWHPDLGEHGKGGFGVKTQKPGAKMYSLTWYPSITHWAHLLPLPTKEA